MNIFDRIYFENTWNGGSGPGSKEETTREYRAFVQKFMDEHGVKTVLDYGCGDGLVASLMDWTGRYYKGVDASGIAVAMSKTRGLNAHELEPICYPFDLVLIKDVFQHLSLESIGKVMDSLVGCRHLLVTNDMPTGEQDGSTAPCEDGQWRPLFFEPEYEPWKYEVVLEFDSAPLRKQVVHVWG